MVHMMMNDVLLHAEGLWVRVAERGRCIIVRISHLGDEVVNSIRSHSEIRCMSLIDARMIPKGTTAHIGGAHLRSLRGDHSFCVVRAGY